MSLRKQVANRGRVSLKRRSGRAGNRHLETTAQELQTAALVQRAESDPRSLSSEETLQLQRTIGNRAVDGLLARTVQRRSKKDTSQVGGESEESFALKGPGDTKWVNPGEGGFAERLQGATVEVAGSLAGSVAHLKMKTVQPVLRHFDKHLMIANWERDYYKKQKSGFATASTNDAWEERRKHADGKAKEFQKDKDDEQANFQSYNAFVPLANALVSQLTRVSAQQSILGIKDDGAMVTALNQGVEEAKIVGRAARDAYAKNKDDEEVEAPKAQTSVEASLGAVRETAAAMDAAYIDFQQILLNQEIEELKASGADEEKQLKKINDMKDFLKNVGKTIDLTQAKLKSAPEKIANMVNNPSSLIPSAENIAGFIGDFIYYKEVQKLTEILDSINARVQNKEEAKEFRRLLALTKKYKAAVLAFANAARNMQRALHDRRNEYRQLGIRLDRFSQNDPASRKAGRAPAHGGDRYGTMMSLIVELRQACALARFAQDGLPALSGTQEEAAPGGEAGGKAAKWAAWAIGVVKRRNSYASYIMSSMQPRINMPEDEEHALNQVYQYLAQSDTICAETLKRYGDLDKKAGELMTALGGMSEV